ncbi:MAG TPA: KUP/HAK/KT family potassium transporter [Planctomycetaceae bacterium]|nr:KUP/HAK/KT family potassium transporter [Planctomycetaceae bacterium]
MSGQPPQDADPLAVVLRPPPQGMAAAALPGAQGVCSNTGLLPDFTGEISVASSEVDAVIPALAPANGIAALHGEHSARMSALVLGALGVVFGDIGTSPLYTLKECLLAAGGAEARTADLYGILSLMLWALVMVVTVKYLCFVMRADHHGEGGIFALLAIVPDRFRTHTSRKGRITGMSLLAVIGASLLYGDGVITPAISVLSAVEGLAVASPRLSSLVLPLTCGILVALFAIQSRGTGSIGKLFGLVMTVWFVTLAVLGLHHIVQRPEILGALSPHHAVAFFQRHGLRGMLILGSVVLAVTGGEALYADMGHFGVRPIRLAWTVFVLPALALCYLGQGALVLRDPRAVENPFYSMVPPGLPTYLLIVLSSAATVIASQALISGAFSLTRQAMLLGYLPQVTIKHTAYHTEGQIYIPEVNTLLAVGCLALVLTFRESVKLAAAYGIAVTGTMAITSVLYYIVTRYSWGWSNWKAGALLALFLSFDIPFLLANMFKFFDGGYVPMLIGAALIAGMLIWSRGRTALMESYARRYSTFDTARPILDRWLSKRVPGTAVFLSPSPDHVPPILVHHVERTRSLHENVILLTVERATTPVVPEESRSRLTVLGDGFHRLVVSFGYMEEPLLLPALRAATQTLGIPFDVADTTYYVGLETIVMKDEATINHIPAAIFAYLNRNAVHEERRYGMPLGQIVEIGAQIDL